MRIKWRNKDAEHELNFRFIYGSMSIQAYCNCGDKLLTGSSIEAADAIFAYNNHLENVRKRQAAKDRANRFH